MTLLIADKKMNRFMENCDMKPATKWFVTPMVVSYDTETKIDEAYIMKIIDASFDKADTDFLIPGVVFCGVLYCREGVTEISDGEKIIHGG
jgi:hypothetical protein